MRYRRFDVSAAGQLHCAWFHSRASGEIQAWLLSHSIPASILPTNSKAESASVFSPVNGMKQLTLPLGDRREDPEVMGETRPIIMLSLDARLLQRLLHHLRIVAQRIKLARSKVHGREVGVLVRREDGEGRRILGVGAGLAEEDFHARFVDDGRAVAVFFVRLVVAGVLGGHVVVVRGDGHQGDDALEGGFQA